LVGGDPPLGRALLGRLGIELDLKLIGLALVVTPADHLSDVMDRKALLGHFPERQERDLHARTELFIRHFSIEVLAEASMLLLVAAHEVDDLLGEVDHLLPGELTGHLATHYEVPNWRR
jgi:hypothetical protein